MLVTPFGIVTLVRLLQPSNAPTPMPVTLLGMVTLVRLVQLANVLLLMLVTPVGMVTLVRLLQPLPTYQLDHTHEHRASEAV
jgi:hypothetical protein